MSEISRRAFLARTGAGVATAGIIATIPSLATRAGAAEPSKRSAEALPTERSLSSEGPSKANGPLVVHVPDVGSGEIHFMIGTREVVHTDRALVARLMRATS